MSDILKRFDPIALKTLATEIVAGVENGELDPLQVYARAKHLEQFADILTKNVKSQANDEADKYEKNFEFDGFKCELRNSGDRYDYSLDAEYAELSARLAERKAVLDLAIKQHPNELVVNGEIIPVMPVKTYGQIGLVLTAKK